MKSRCDSQQIELVEGGVVPSSANMSYASPFAADENQRLLDGGADDLEE
jgi:hypothetical protein